MIKDDNILIVHFLDSCTSSGNTDDAGKIYPPRPNLVVLRSDGDHVVLSWRDNVNELPLSPPLLREQK